MPGKHYAGGCKCCGPCDFLFTVRGCSIIRPEISGATVTLSQSGTPVASGVTSGRVVAIARGAAGTGYTSPPTVTISGAGTGAAATATLQVNSLTRTSGGSGYTNGSFRNGTFTGGGGSGATFSYSVSGGVINPTLTITNFGIGYTSLPTPVFNAGPGTGAAATPTMGVGQVVVTNGGENYGLAGNTATLSGGGGSGASANVTSVIPGVVLSVRAGTYDYDVTPPEGYTPVSSSGVVLTCGGGSIRTDLTIAPGYFCSTCCGSPLPLVWFIEDDYGVHTLTHGVGSPGLPAGDSWGLDFTATGLPSVDASCVSSPDTPIRYVLLLDCPSGTVNGWSLYISYWIPTCSPTTANFSNNKLNVAIINLTGPKLSPDCNPTSLTFNIPTVISPITMVPTPGGGGTIVATR